MKKFDLSSLGKWIILATVLGAVTGLAMGKDASMFAPVGNLFMTLIKMIVVPMVFSPWLAVRPPWEILKVQAK